MTHDLLTKIISILKAKVVRVIINEIVDNTFYAVIELAANDSDKLTKIDARPSDAIAISVRTKCPIIVSESVMMKAKMVNSEKDEKETENFKNFIDNINPEDFSKYLDSR